MLQMKYTDGQRHPIRKKVRGMVLVISLFALTLAIAVGGISMLRIHKNNETALRKQMEQNLTTIVTSRAAMAETELGKYVIAVQIFSNYLHELYSGHPAPESLDLIQPPNIKNANRYAMQRLFRNRDISLEDVREELLLLAHMEHLWRPVMIRDARSILSVYYATKKGVGITYDRYSQMAIPREGDTEIYYDYFNAPWYLRVMRTKQLGFTDVYRDSFGRGLVVTCSAPVYDEKNEFAGVVAMDIQVSVLYKAIVEMDLGEGAFAFLVDKEGNLLEATENGGTSVKNIYYSYAKEIGYKVAGRILRGKTGVSLAPNRVYYGYTTIPATGWKLCIRVPESMVLAPMESVKRGVVMTAVLFFAAFLVIIWLVAMESKKFSNRLTYPIIALKKDVEKISNGDLDYRANVYDNDEVGDLANEFNRMATSLKNYIQDFAAIAAERERIRTELNVAAQIQVDLLPCTFPPFPDRLEFDIYATMTPAKEVGGDFYDFFFIDNDHLALVIADVSGKGMPAALFMVITRTLIKNRAQMGGKPSEILEAVNNQLCEENGTELFVTVWLGILEISTGKVVACNAGHEYPVVRRMETGTYERVKRAVNNPAVATMEGMKYYESSFFMNPGDSLFLYTDGVVEATNAEYEIYGRNRMTEALNRHGVEPVERLLVSLKREVDAFAGGAPQFDDITMLALQYYGKRGLADGREAAGKGSRR
ncbi:MAG: SpoIIE family protein phosphatase [Fretibacterium sp.]|nr:SpoIIE family protein phosphatase [Fretibacterium sp.]